MTTESAIAPPLDRATKFHHAAGAALAFFAVLIVFGRTFTFRFVLWDDDINLIDNPHIRSLTLENLRWMFTDFGHVMRYKPLSWLAWSADYALWGMDPRGYHIMNLVYHAFGASLGYFIMLKIARDAFGLRQPTSMDAFLMSAAVILWAIHPLRAEPVAWISGRHYVQGTLFLAASHLLDPGLCRDSLAIRRINFRSVLSITAFAVSVFTYPLALEWPLVLLLLDAANWKQNRPGDGFPWKMALLHRAPLFVLSILVTGINIVGRYTLVQNWRAPTSLAEFSLLDRILQAAYSLAVYPIRMIVPWKLSPYYSRLTDFSVGDPMILTAAAFVVLMTLALLLIARRTRWPLACWLAYCILMFTKLGWTESPHFANDRYGHIGLFAASVAIFWGARSFLNRPRRTAGAESLATPFVSVILMIYALAAYSQAEIWRDTETLMKTMSTRLGPNQFQSEILWRLGEGRRLKNDPAGALNAYTDAVEANPDDTRARYHRAMMLIEMGHKTEAAQEFEEVLESKEDLKLRLQLAGLLLETNQVDAAIPHLIRAAELDLSNLLARVTLGQIYESKSEWTNALAVFEQAARIAPDRPEIQQSLARIRAKAGTR